MHIFLDYYNIPRLIKIKIKRNLHKLEKLQNFN